MYKCSNSGNCRSQAAATERYGHKETKPNEKKINPRNFISYS